eukprot:scaffold26906_cov24-Prasinocladus_malaysianus.AAC.1
MLQELDAVQCFENPTGDAYSKDWLFLLANKVPGPHAESGAFLGLHEAIRAILENEAQCPTGLMPRCLSFSPMQLP